jgi:hypothetical protein
LKHPASQSAPSVASCARFTEQRPRNARRQRKSAVLEKTAWLSIPDIPALQILKDLHQSRLKSVISIYERKVIWDEYEVIDT